jgi:hypothetical protein
MKSGNVLVPDAEFRFTKVQVLVGWLYFSLLFKILLPRWSDQYVADPWDVLAYGIGAAFFYRFINKLVNDE